MGASNKPTLPSAAEVRAQIDEAEQQLTAATAALGEAMFVRASLADRDVGPEQTAVDAARQRVEQLQAMLPIAENAEQAALEETRAKLAQEQRRRLAKELEGLIKPVLQFSVAYQNAVSAWRRACDVVDRARALLPTEMRRHGLGWERRLSAPWLHEKCSLEIARLGLVPLADRPFGVVLSAPGARADAVQTLQQANSPQIIPPLETEVRQMVAALMTAVQESGNAAGLPEVATDPGDAPTAAAEAPTGITIGEGA